MPRVVVRPAWKVLVARCVGGPPGAHGGDTMSRGSVEIADVQ